MKVKAPSLTPFLRLHPGVCLGPMLTLILMVLGFVLFLLSGLGIPGPSPDRPSRFNMLAFGLACWILAELLKNGPGLLR